MFGAFGVKGKTFAESGRDILFVLIRGPHCTVLAWLAFYQKRCKFSTSDDNEIGREKQLIDGIADTLVSVHPICNHPFLNETRRPVRRSSGPVPMRVFFDYVHHILPSAPRHFIYGAVTSRQSGLHEATHFLVRPK